MNDFKPIVDNPRVYLDYSCDEYKRIDVKKKLLDMAMFLEYGSSLHEIVAEYRNRNEPHKTSTVYDTFLGYLVYMRTGEYTSWLRTFLKSRLNESQLIDVLSVELLGRLRVTPRRQGKYSYDFDMTHDPNLDNYVKAKNEAQLIYGEYWDGKKDVSKDSRELLVVANPWLRIAQEIEADDFKNPTEAVHPEDDQIVYEFNAYAKDKHRLVLNLPPEPFQGNPLDAEVVILMLNPGFVEPCNVGKYNALDEAGRKKFIKAKCATMSMQDKLCIPDDEVINDIGEGYWKRKLKSVLEIPNANQKVAIVQFLGYFSEKYNEIPKRFFRGNDRLLYTQKYTMRLVRYLMQEGKVIIIARSKKRWYKHIPELETYEKKVLLKSYLNPTISPANCADGGFELIKAALAEDF